jgi:hypothetical protein
MPDLKAQIVEAGQGHTLTDFAAVVAEAIDQLSTRIDTLEGPKKTPSKKVS